MLLFEKSFDGQSKFPTNSPHSFLTKFELRYDIQIMKTDKLLLGLPIRGLNQWAKPIV